MIRHRFVFATMAAATVLSWGVIAHAATVEYWDFENSSSTGGAPLNDYWFTDTLEPRSEANGSNGSYGVNGTLARGWSEEAGPQFDSDDLSGANAGHFAMDTVDNSGDAYLTEGALHNWSSSDWTVELHAKLDESDGWETYIGRDGTSFAVAEADFYLQRKGMDANELRLNYRTADGNQYILDGTSTLELGQWYGLAIVADSDDTNPTISLYIDNGSGYALEGQLTSANGITGDLGIYNSAINWTFGRGWYNGGFADFIDGHLDNIRFSDVALSVDELTPLAPVPEPASFVLIGLGGLALLACRRK